MKNIKNVVSNVFPFLIGGASLLLTGIIVGRSQTKKLEEHILETCGDISNILESCKETN